MSYKYTFRVEPITYLLCSNGDTSATYDAQFVFDENGYPYFPGKTFKGLLKESMIEVLEMMGKDENKIIAIIGSLFGISGGHNQEGLLLFNNLYLPDYIQKLSEAHPTANRLGNISKFITTIQQTALNEKDIEDGKSNIISYKSIAKEGSLRTLAVLDYTKVNSFVSEFTSPHTITGETFIILERAFKHLRYAGMNRNRGLGKCQCSLLIEKINDTLQTENINSATSEFDFLELKITTKEPIVLGTQTADQNTVFSQDYITGNQIWGAMAWIHRDFESDDFKELFLSGNLSFGFCYPEDSFPVPNAIHREKYEPKNEAKIFNLLDSVPENIVTKGVGGMLNDNGKVSIQKTFNFHNSRPQRSAGRSLENDGTIFYYESINKITCFIGRITGNTVLLEKLIRKLGNKGTLNLGRSKNAQYGTAGYELSKKTYETKEDTKPETGTYYLVAQTPILLMNDYGFPSPTLKELAEELNIKPTNIKSASASYIAVEQYNAVWQAKTGQLNAYEKGSTFRIDNYTPKKKEDFIGMMTEKGFGKIRFYTNAEINEIIELSKKESNTTTKASIDNFTLHTVDKEAQSRVKIKGYGYAAKGWKLSNSLISRMLFILKNSETEGQINEKLKDMEGKQAWNALKNCHLIDDLHETKTLKGIIPSDKTLIFLYSNFEEYKVFWTAFFQALRKANSKK